MPDVPIPNPGQDPPDAPPDVAVRRPDPVSPRLFAAGFITALMLSGITLILSATQLMIYMVATNQAVETILAKDQSSVPRSAGANDLRAREETMRMAIITRMIAARLALLSCGIFVGMAFGFLGFALFLIGIREEMDVEASAEKYQVKLARMSPGVFVLLCSTLLIGFCVNFSIPYEFTRTTSRSIPLDEGKDRDAGSASAAQTDASALGTNKAIADEFLNPAKPATPK